MIFFLFFLSLFGWGMFTLVKDLHTPEGFRRKVPSYALIASFLVALLMFCYGMSWFDAGYNDAIVQTERGYEPFATVHRLTLIVFLVLSFSALIAVTLQGRELPPMVLVLCIAMIVTGFVVNVFVLAQVTQGADKDRDAFWTFVPLPLLYAVVSVYALVKVARQESVEAAQRTYRNAFLQRINSRMAHTRQKPLWALVLALPLFVLIIAILTLLGQQPDALIKAFTETTTWRFSEHGHPAYVFKDEHYLCTVAACGHAEVVKPLRKGRRHGREIIVNRQLQVANAFEELIRQGFPRLHRFIRYVYDRYGFPLSHKITTPRRSNLVYRLMKPLEYVFLLVLYCCSLRPEERIARQYAL